MTTPAGQLICVDFKNRCRASSNVQKPFSEEAFRTFWLGREEMLESTLYSMVKDREIDDMSLGDYMVWLKYDPEIRERGWDCALILFRLYPYKQNENTAIHENGQQY